MYSRRTVIVLFSLITAMSCVRAKIGTNREFMGNSLDQDPIDKRKHAAFSGNEAPKTLYNDEENERSLNSRPSADNAPLNDALVPTANNLLFKSNMPLKNLQAFLRNSGRSSESDRQTLAASLQSIVAFYATSAAKIEQELKQSYNENDREYLAEVNNILGESEAVHAQLRDKLLNGTLTASDVVGERRKLGKLNHQLVVLQQQQHK